jgi:hypothetical protein
MLEGQIVLIKIRGFNSVNTGFSVGMKSREFASRLRERFGR